LREIGNIQRIARGMVEPLLARRLVSEVARDISKLSITLILSVLISAALLIDSLGNGKVEKCCLKLLANSSLDELLYPLVSSVANGLICLCMCAKYTQSI
jgi:hypothetical protein